MATAEILIADACYLEYANSTTNHHDGIIWGHDDLKYPNERRPLQRCTITTGDVPAGATINDARLYGYGAIALYDSQTVYSRLYRLRDETHAFVDTQATWLIYATGSSWSTAGAKSGANDIDTTVASTVRQLPQTVLAWEYWTITDMVIDAINNRSGVLSMLGDMDEPTDAVYSWQPTSPGGADAPYVWIDYTAAGAAYISKISGVDWANVSKVSGVAEASISKVSGVTAN